MLVAAVADNGVIGVDGGIPWRIAEDFAHFKATTMGHTLVMGRATYDSIGRPLPGRTTVVLTRDPSWSADGVLVAASFEAALDLADGLPGEVMVVGGAAVYAEALAVRRRADPDRGPPVADRRHVLPAPSTRPTGWQPTARRSMATTG